MERLVFDSPPIEFLHGGVVGATLTPYVGLMKLRFLEEIPTRFKYDETHISLKRDIGDEVVFYALHYGKYVKLGSTKASHALSRMYSQAPIAGIVISKLMMMNDAVDLESSLERPLAKKLSSLFRCLKITQKRESVEVLINDLVSGKVSQEETIRSLREVSENSWELLWDRKDSYVPITSPSEYWFTTLISDEDLETLRVVSYLRNLSKLKKTECYRKHCKGTLTILHNAICVLSVLSRKYVEYCDRVSYNLLIEVE